MPRGVQRDAPPSGTVSGRLIFRRQMDRLAEVEALPVYAEMCAAADARALAGNRLDNHGWGEFCGSPRKTRKEAEA